MSKFYLTPHAVERYQRRVSPHLSNYDAHDELERLCHGARQVKRRTYQGQPLWAVGGNPPSAYLVCKHECGTEVCVTILTPELLDGGAADSSTPFADEDTHDVLEELANRATELRAENEAMRAEISRLVERLADVVCDKETA